MPKQFRFAVTATRADSAQEWTAKARRIEELGYSALLMPDHISPQLAPVPALMAAAAVTTRLRVGSFVFANDFRNPVLLAKEAATIDFLSDGRLDFGLGAGWSTPDYEMLGIPYDPPAVRVARMRESLQLIRRTWTEDEVEHSGKHYNVRGAKVLPKTAQQPHPPIMIGGAGPVVLRFAARNADIVALAPGINEVGQAYISQLTDAGTAERVKLIREAAGERYESLIINTIVLDAQVSDQRSSLLENAAVRFKATVAALIGSPYFLYGTLPQLRTELLERRARLGISYYSIPDRAMEAFAPLARELVALA